MIFSIWQNAGDSSHQLAATAAQLLNEKTTHTGTLDPMAQGVLVLLSGPDRFAKESLSIWQKTYEFSILWGVSTDSGDALGLITSAKPLEFTAPILESKISKVCAAFPNTYSQQIPDFSARRFKGESAHTHARLGTQIPAKFRQITLSDIKMQTIETMQIQAILRNHSDAIHKIVGDFRQDEIKSNWNNTLAHPFSEIRSQAHQELIITHHTTTVSAGCYVRQLTQDIAKIVGLPATTWAITRIKNGPFDQLDCIEIDELTHLR
ncbi:MAG: hypothetical protein WAU07_02290 [Microgenomates group bacterium]